jgi:RimJ/RimL family protein N-acetyltransferase
MQDQHNSTDFPMPIVTPRLMLRPIKVGDEIIIHEAKYESWAELHPWMVWTWCPRDEMTVEENEPFCRRKQEQFSAREDMTLLAFDKEKGHLIGSAGLHKCDWNNRTGIVGFWIRTSETGKGYAAEAATAIGHYAFQALKMDKLLTCHHEGNLGSQKTIEKLGFQRKPERDGQRELNGRMVNEYWFEMPDEQNLPPLELKWGPAAIMNYKKEPLAP